MSGTSSASANRLWAQLFCDDGAANVKFIRVFEQVDDDSSAIVVDTDLDGNLYAVIGNAITCEDSHEWVVLCDTITNFLRRISTDDNGDVTIEDFTLAGAPYVVVGAVSRCTQAVSGTVTVGNQRDDEYEILCDAGAANLPFLRRYRTDSAGTVTIVNTTLDGTTAYVVVGAAARCTAITGTVSITNLASDDEMEVLCDAGAANLPFLRQYAYPPGGGAPVVSNFALDGVTPYVVIGPVARCTSVTVSNFPATQPISGSVSILGAFDDEYQVLCDTTPTTFIRRYRTDSIGAVTITNFTLAGGAFVPVGAVGNCGVIISDGSGPITVDGTVSVSNNRDDEWEVLCDAGAAGAQFLRRYRTDSAGVVTSANFLLDGTTAYVVLGVATACRGISGTLPLPAGAATLAAQRDDEYEILCDTVTTFLRRYRTDSAGVVTITDTTLNGTTAYVVVGAVTNCAGDSRNDNFIVLCDNAGSFLRRYAVSGAGVLTVTNLTLAGGAYVPVGTVTQCGENTGSITVTLLSGVASVVSSVLARRITFVYGSNNGTAANRPSINGVATLESPNGISEQINTLVIGTLDSPNTLPAITYATNLAGDTANVIQEF